MAESPLTTEQVIERLQSVHDPVIERSIVDLGMVKNVRIDDGRVTLHVELTTPAYPERERLERAIRDAVQSLPDAPDVAIDFSAKVRASGAGMANREAMKGVKNVIAVASGKGGVGKSTVAVNLAISLAQDGASVGLLDADVYGPSLPMMLGIQGRPMMRDNKIVPLSVFGLKVMSIGFLIDADRALIWRGPLVSQLITQFLNDVDWGELDYLVIDLPPGTGDVQLTLVQRIPISGAVIVTTPQDVALADAVKGLAMFEEVKTTVLGIIENMSFFICPKCGQETPIFGTGGGERTATKHGVPLLGQIPLETAIRNSGDIGQPIVVSYPDSPPAEAFRQAARRAAGQLAIDAVNRPRKAKIMLKSVG